MAEDTRDVQSQPQPRGPPPGATAPPEHIQNATPKTYEVFSAPPPSANALPDGYGQNTAGARPAEYGLGDAVKTVHIKDLAQVHMYPCVRESLLTGIAGGFAMGGVRGLFGGEALFSFHLLRGGGWTFTRAFLRIYLCSIVPYKLLGDSRFLP
jgi:cytochrome c oxidase assembly protein subunit 20